jgi:tetratricopeptide (TPR) repeat protein
LDEVVDAYTTAGLVDEAAALCAEVGYLQVWLNRFPESFATYTRGLTIVGEQRTAARSQLLALHGAMMGLAGFFEAGAAMLDEAEDIARSIGDDRALGRVLWGRSMAEWSNSRPQAAISSGRAAIETLRPTTDHWSLVDAFAWTSYPLLLSGRPDDIEEGRRISAEGMELGRRLGHRGGEVLCLRGVSIARLLGGDLDTFEAVARTDLEGFESVGSPWVCQSHTFLAVLHLFRGDLDLALESVRRAGELEPASAWAGPAQAYEALTHAWRGDVDECERLLEAVRAGLPTDGGRPPFGKVVAAMALVQASVVAGRPETAAALYPLVAEWVDDVPMSGFDHALSDRIAGMAAAAAERWDDAAAHFEAALHTAEVATDTLDRPQVEHWYAEMLLARGRPEDRDRARELLTAAVERYRTLGMPLLEARAADALARA